MPVIPISVKARQAEKLVLKKVTSETLSALKLVVLNDNDEWELGDPATYEESLVVGVSTTAGLVGADVSVHMFGKLEDASFIFPLHDNLFLGLNGVITNVPPSLPTAHSTLIGVSLGAGSIFIRIDQPIIL